MEPKHPTFKSWTMTIGDEFPRGLPTTVIISWPSPAIRSFRSLYWVVLWAVILVHDKGCQFISTHTFCFSPESAFSFARGWYCGVCFYCWTQNSKNHGTWFCATAYKACTAHVSYVDPVQTTLLSFNDLLSSFATCLAGGLQWCSMEIRVT